MTDGQQRRGKERGQGQGLGVFGDSGGCYGLV